MARGGSSKVSFEGPTVRCMRSTRGSSVVSLVCDRCVGKRSHLRICPTGVKGGRGGQDGAADAGDATRPTRLADDEPSQPGSGRARDELRPEHAW